MPLASYNSLYELFGGISSALIGLKTAREYLAKKFRERAEAIAKKIEDLNLRIPNLKEEINESRSWLEGSLSVHEPEEIPLPYQTFKDELSKMEDDLTDFDGNIQKVVGSPESGCLIRTPSEEEEYAIRFGVNLSLFSFCYCLLLLIISGLEDNFFFYNSRRWDNRVDQLTPYEIIAHFNLLAGIVLVIVTALFIINIWFKFAADLCNAIRTCEYVDILGGFILIAFLAVVLSVWNPEILPPLRKNISALSALFICSLPIWSLLIRYSAYLGFKYRRAEKDVKSFENQFSDLQSQFANTFAKARTGKS